MNESNFDRRESMLSVPARWSELYFDIFAILCVLGEGFVIYYGISERPPDANAPDVAANMLLRLAAVPIVAALQAYLIMRARDLAMKTWETFRMERYNKGRVEGREEGRVEGRVEGREEGREEGRGDLAREMMELINKREPGEGVGALYEFLSKISENGKSENDDKERGA